MTQHLPLHQLLDRLDPLDETMPVMVDSYQRIVDVVETAKGKVQIVTEDAEAVQACVEFVHARRKAGDLVATAILAKYASQLDAE